MREQFVPIKELIDKLWTLHQEHYTGMVFITTIDERSAQISLLEGAIVSLFFRNQRDEQALPLLSEIQWCRFRIAKMPVKQGHAILPSTSDILQFLAAESAATSDSTPVLSASTHASLSDTIKNILQEELVAFLGPIAAVVCAEQLATATDVQSAITTLAGEIPDTEEAEEFTRNASNKLMQYFV